MSTEHGGFGRGVTALILSYNEAPNLERVLARLDWVAEIVVVDSGSDDGTLEILARQPKVRCVQRAFDGQASQWNFGLTQTGIATEWVLALDADYVLSDELVAELRALQPAADIHGYLTRFVYCIAGRRLRGTLYPPHVTLFRRAAGHYLQDGHTQRLRLDGACGTLRAAILHDDRKPLSRWLWSQERYATLNAARLLRGRDGALRLQDRLRRMIVVMPLLMPLYSLTVKRGALDGWHGMYYALQRGVAEAILSLKLIEGWLRKMRRED